MRVRSRYSWIVMPTRLGSSLEAPSLATDFLNILKFNLKI
ncbi:hypothetical protein CAMRE0001_0931 [Campylobacter rectus RM3267]|uniref:Uncharacterized protein n=1 Tax=Campylobacter rectus RM3267 TaxID=553218 RepID=B9D2J9_CAMRE|nr:hypothetical protein CAMRE0001_0931 [Campylobacter rectus RM3267]